MAKAADLVSATISILRDLRTDSKWEQIFKYVKDVASFHNIHAELSRAQRSRQLPRRYEGGLVMDTTGSREGLLTSQNLKVAIFFPILDAMLSELDLRFSKKNLEHMRSVQACSPHSPNFLKPSSIHTLADSYGLDMDLLSIECSLAKPTLLGKSMDTIADVLVELSSLRISFPLLTKLLQIALT